MFDGAVSQHIRSNFDTLLESLFAEPFALGRKQCEAQFKILSPNLWTRRSGNFASAPIFASLRCHFVVIYKCCF